jgi:2-oxoglutarate dehydrogenase E1 component
MKLQDIYNKLKKVYSGNVGYEFTYIDNQDQKNWILDQIEQDSFHETTKERKLEIFSYLCENNTFNEFLKNKFPTSKRFGIEGCDTSISALKALVSVAGEEKLDHLVFGMAHRGRLNTLALVMRKPFEEIFAEFKELKYEQSHLIDNEWGKMGDVKVKNINVKVSFGHHP